MLNLRASVQAVANQYLRAKGYSGIPPVNLFIAIVRDADKESRQASTMPQMMKRFIPALHTRETISRILVIRFPNQGACELPALANLIEGKIWTMQQLRKFRSA